MMIRPITLLLVPLVGLLAATPELARAQSNCGEGLDKQEELLNKMALSGKDGQERRKAGLKIVEEGRQALAANDVEGCKKAIEAAKAVRLGSKGAKVQ